ncbi:hypothetical protein BYT27DRAFT_7235947 [Phlegmacium glaucopus]|nr:hypothetical protein BYT27DRAFT_7235947 [Phlegmacium glaucopus]
MFTQNVSGLARNYVIPGEESITKIRQGGVVVVDFGGVGIWAAVILARCVSKIRLVDFVYVTLSFLNRHATAVLPEVGTPKVTCIENTLKQIAKWVQVDSRIELWRKDEGADWRSRKSLFIQDAIDNIQTNAFSSMGAGAKCEPTQIQISDMSNTIYDSLARSVRRRLHLLGVNSGIPVVYSTEVPGDVKLLLLPEEEFQKGSLKELSAFNDFLVKIDNSCASNSRFPIDEDDIALMFEEICKDRSLPPHDVPTRPTLVR